MEKLFYHIEILETPDFVQQIHSDMSDEESEITSDINVDMIDIIEGNQINTYVYGDKMSVGDVCSFLEAKDVHYKLKEITDVVLSQNISFEDELFSDLVKKHIESNLTIDMVLEKLKKKVLAL